MQLFTNQASDATSSPYRKKGVRAGGKMNVYLYGSTGGGTVTLEAKAPNGFYVPLQGPELTSPGLYVIETAPAVIRANLTGATGASLSIWVEEDSLETLREVQER